MGLRWWLRPKESVCNIGGPGWIPGSGRSPGERNGNLLQYSCLENSIDRSQAACSPCSARVGHQLATKPQDKEGKKKSKFFWGVGLGSKGPDWAHGNISCLFAAGFMNMKFNRSRCLQPIGGSRSCGGRRSPRDHIRKERWSFDQIAETWKESSLQFSRSVVADSMRLHELQGARQASLSITNFRSSFKLKSIESVMPSSHLILCRPLLLLLPNPPSIRVFSNESTLCMRWPKYWSFSFSISPSREHTGLISFRMNWLDLLAVQGTLKRKESGGGKFIKKTIED